MVVFTVWVDPLCSWCSAAAGSFPNSALFFCVYETSKPVLREYVGESNPARAQTLAGALGEVVSGNCRSLFVLEVVVCVVGMYEGCYMLHS